MKKVFFFLLAVSSCTMSIAQDTGKIESLDSFFAGIPLRERYEKWVLHLATHFGIDSTNERGLYSSFKPDTKSHFPFPDSVQVKILLYTAVNTQTSGSIPVDTVRSILIEGVFGSSKNAKKDAYSYFNELKSVLRIHYKKKLPILRTQ